MNLYTLFFRYRFVFGFSPEGEHKVRPYIGFGHWLGFGFCLRQHFPLTFTYAHIKWVETYQQWDDSQVTSF
jgi:hypothetical protein